MSEELGIVIGRGFDTWKRNIGIAFPFVLDMLFSGIFFLLVAGVVALVIGIDVFLSFTEGAGAVFGSMEAGENPQIVEIFGLVELIRPYIGLLLVAFFIVVVGWIIIRTFFRAGAIGMAKIAVERGSAGFGEMILYAKRCFVNLLLLDVLIGLLILAGIVFMLPAILVSQSSPGGSGGFAGNSVLLILGTLVWFAYMVVVSIVLMVAPYALVVDSLHPLDAVRAGFGFFTSHKLDVVMLLILTIAISILPWIILGNIPFVGGVLNMLVAVIVIQPLTLVWWVRLYMAKTGRTMYVNELLLHPDDLREV
ncbi:hypothetical protein B6U67_02910 [Methanosarcinales archaeon ex4484_138]|nr:MAG: hypothetical protein B6U67_02910 [Methanosarcinales archaeon ex4484_138]